MKQLLIGTNNPSKLQMIGRHLEGLAVQCVSPSELGLQTVTSAESAREALGNAIEKARMWHNLTGLPVLTEDSGLVFLDLPLDHPDQPCVHVRRAAGHIMDDEEMIDWFAAIAHRHGGLLRAAWQDAWCLMFNDQDMATIADAITDLHHWSFRMTDVPCAARHPGWPLDSLSLDRSGRYFAEYSVPRAKENAPAEIARQRMWRWLREKITDHLLKSE